jgi:hypothetical protein
MSRSKLERQLSDTHRQLLQARDELAVADQHVAIADEMADEARLQALVSESPLDNREYEEAARHAAATHRGREDVAHRVKALERLLDQLLDRFVAEPG